VVALASLVTVMVDGAFVASAPPPLLVDGRILAPPALVAQLADRVDVASDGSLTAQRGNLRCAAAPAAVGDPAPVALAPLLRCLGAELHWDAAAKTLAVSFSGPVSVQTLPVFDPNAPQVRPTVIFTPEPAPPTPRTLVTGVPRPRRTAVPAIPSLPLATMLPRP
jgi:hypothetical protein